MKFELKQLNNVTSDVVYSLNFVYAFSCDIIHRGMLSYVYVFLHIKNKQKILNIFVNYDFLLEDLPGCFTQTYNRHHPN